MHDNSKGITEIMIESTPFTNSENTTPGFEVPLANETSKSVISNYKDPEKETEMV